jgi:hypothetical protein
LRIGFLFLFCFILVGFWFLTVVVFAVFMSLFLYIVLVDLVLRCLSCRVVCSFSGEFSFLWQRYQITLLPSIFLGLRMWGGFLSNIESVVVGSVIADKAEAHRLAVCLFFKRVFVTESSFSEGFHRSQNLCTLEGGSCGSCGNRLKFKSCFDGCRVVWVCPKVIGLPELER